MDPMGKRDWKKTTAPELYWEKKKKKLRSDETDGRGKCSSICVHKMRVSFCSSVFTDGLQWDGVRKKIKSGSKVIPQALR